MFTKSTMFTALRLTLVCLVLFAGIYPLLIWGGAKLAPGGGKSTTVQLHGRTAGYELIGQSFSGHGYFWSRPSAVNYNAAGSGGSNKGPSNPAYLQEVNARIDTFLVYHPYLHRQDIPSEMITASGSGLDPHISVQGAEIQVQRVAYERGVEENKITELVHECTRKSLLGLTGMRQVHVLRLNTLLDERYPMIRSNE